MQIEVDRLYDSEWDDSSYFPKMVKKGTIYTVIADNKEEEKVAERIINSIIKSNYISTEDLYKELGVKSLFLKNYTSEILNKKFLGYRVPVFAFEKERRQVENFWKKEVIEKIKKEIEDVSSFVTEDKLMETGQMLLREISRQIAEIREQNREPTEIVVDKITLGLLSKYLENLINIQLLETGVTIFGIPVTVDSDTNKFEVRINARVEES